MLQDSAGVVSSEFQNIVPHTDNLYWRASENTIRCITKSSRNEDSLGVDIRIKAKIKQKEEKKYSYK